MDAYGRSMRCHPSRLKPSFGVRKPRFRHGGRSSIQFLSRPQCHATGGSGVSHGLIWTPWTLTDFTVSSYQPAIVGYGSIPIDTFLVGWTSIYQLFWGSLGTRVLTHPQLYMNILWYTVTMYDLSTIVIGNCNHQTGILQSHGPESRSSFPASVCRGKRNICAG